MTTIAYKDGVMACDSLYSLNDQRATESTKIVALTCGAIYGCAGDNDDRALVKLMQAGDEFSMPSHEELRKVKQELIAMVVFPSKRIYVITTAPEDSEDEVGVTEIERDFWAIGSGAPFAIGAMHRGAGAEDAVRTAIHYDMNSGLPVHQMKLA